MKIVMLAVTGLRAQVITETLYALNYSSRRYLDAIHVITTRDGKEKSLLSFSVEKTGTIRNGCLKC